MKTYRFLLYKGQFGQKQHIETWKWYLDIVNYCLKFKIADKMAAEDLVINLDGTLHMESYCFLEYNGISRLDQHIEHTQMVFLQC